MRPQKLNLRNGKDRPFAKIEPCENFPLYSIQNIFTDQN